MRKMMREVMKIQIKKMMKKKKMVMRMMNGVQGQKPRNYEDKNKEENYEDEDIL